MKIIIYILLIFGFFSWVSASTWPLSDTFMRYITLSGNNYTITPPDYYSVQVKILSASGSGLIYDGVTLIGNTDLMDTTYIAHDQLIISGDGEFSLSISIIPSSYDPSWDIVLSREFITTFYMWQSVATVFVFFLVFIFKIIKRWSK